jgi:hypothetical protein
LTHDRGRLARRWGLNAESEITRQILEDPSRPVDEFISKYRKASVRRRFPAEFLPLTLEEALDRGDPAVRKLLTDSRWLKR